MAILTRKKWKDWTENEWEYERGGGGFHPFFLGKTFVEKQAGGSDFLERNSYHLASSNKTTTIRPLLLIQTIQNYFSIRFPPPPLNDHGLITCAWYHLKLSVHNTPPVAVIHPSSFLKFRNMTTSPLDSKPMKAAHLMSLCLWRRGPRLKLHKHQSQNSTFWILMVCAWLLW